CSMPAVAILTSRSLSPCLSVTFLLSACSSAAFRSSAMVGCLRLAPFGLPLCPGLNWYSRGGRPGPTLYSWSTVFVFAATGSLVFCSIFMPRSGGDRAGGALCRDRLEGFTRVGEHGRLAA